MSPPPRFLGDVSLGSLALLDQIVVSGTNFLTIVLISQFSSRADLGLFSLAWTIVGFLRTAQERIVSAPYVVFIHRPQTDRRSILGSSLTHHACFAMLGSIGVIVCAVLLAMSDTLSGIKPVLPVLAVSVPLILLRDHIRAVCAAHFRYTLNVLMSSSVAVGQLCGVGLLAWLGKLSIPAVVFCLGVASLLPSVIWLRLRPQPFIVRPAQLRADWSRSWMYARWLAAARVASMAGFLLVPWIVVYYVNTDAAGAFAACSNLVGISLMFVTGMNNLFQPHTVRAFHDHGRRGLIASLFTTIGVFITALSLLSIVLYIGSDVLLATIYGAEFGQFGDVAFYLSLSMLTVCVSIANGNGLAALGNSRGYFLGELAYGVVTLGLALWLIPRHGLVGASWALIGGGAAASAVTSVTLALLIRVTPDVTMSCAVTQEWDT